MIIICKKQQQFIFLCSILELKAVTTSENVALAKESPLKLREIARQFADQAIEKVMIS